MNEMDWAPFVRLANLGHELIAQATTGILPLELRGRVRSVLEEINDERDSFLLRQFEAQFSS